MQNKVHQIAVTGIIRNQEEFLKGIMNA